MADICFSFETRSLPGSLALTLVALPSMPLFNLLHSALNSVKERGSTRSFTLSTNCYQLSAINYQLPSMKSLTEYLWLEIPDRNGFINITPKTEELVHQSGVMEGLCLVNAMHITASVFINDDEPGLHHDYELWLEKLAPHAPTSAYRHNRTGEDNADAHLKRQILGREIVVAITKGKLDFGPWEQIFDGEFDGRKRKRLLVKIIGD
jgi:secondary thiamine-phosphate synthase enzyme